MIRRNSFRSGSGGLGQKVTIRLLDDNEVIQVDFQAHHKGQFLMDYVTRQLNIAEKDYFGLRYVDGSKQRHWMDLGKSVTRQLKDMTPYIICFRFKFYPGDPMLLKEEVSRYQLVLQLRRDLLHGRLHSSNISDIATLASYIVQSELGDYDPEVHVENYVSEYELAARQSADLEEKVKDLHMTLKGMAPAEADILFLRKAATLDTYGIDPHPVKDQKGEQLFIGINHTGISTFQGSKKLTHFKWSQITKLNYEAKMFIVHISVTEDSRNKKKETAGFKCQTAKACKFLWRCAVEQRLFFTSGSAQEVGSVRGGGLFGSKFRYSGKVQKEILEDPGPLRAADGVIQRTPLYRSLQRNKTRSLTQSPMQLGYGSLPRSNHSGPSDDARLERGFASLGSSGSLPLSTVSSPFGLEQGLPVLETLEEDSSPTDEKEEEESPESLPATEMMSSTGSGGGFGDTNTQNRLSGISEGMEEESSNDETKDLVRNGTATGADGPGEESHQQNGVVNSRPKKFSLTLQEKRRKFGIGSGPKLDSLGNASGAALATARKHLGRLREFANSKRNSGEMKGDAVNVPESNTEDTGAPVKDAEEEEQDILADAVEEEIIEYPAFVPTADPEEEKETVFRESRIDQVVVPAPAVTVVFQTVQAAPISSAEKSSSGKESRIILSMWKIFVVCMLCVLVALLFVAILAIELDVDICQKMRRIPEVELFQTEVYEPVKYFIRDKIHNISDNIHNTFH